MWESLKYSNLSKTGIKTNIYRSPLNIVHCPILIWSTLGFEGFLEKENSKSMTGFWKSRKLRLIKWTKAGGGFIERQFYRQTFFLLSAPAHIFTEDLARFYLNILTCGSWRSNKEFSEIDFCWCRTRPAQKVTISVLRQKFILFDLVEEGSRRLITESTWASTWGEGCWWEKKREKERENREKEWKGEKRREKERKKEKKRKGKK